MKKHYFKKCAAALAACSIMASALPVIPTAVSFAAGNIIKNSTFETGTSGWGTYKETGGVCTLTTDSGKLALNISSVGQKNYSVQMFYDIIPLYKNGVYRLKYDISCSTNRYVVAMIQQNGGTYQAYTWKGLNVSPTPQTVDYEFTMEYDTDIMSKLVFNCGLQEKDGTLSSHTIYLDNVSLELVDDSKVDYSANKAFEPDININQVGYKPESKKTAVFRNVSGQKEFSVINAVTKQTVYTGPLSSALSNSSANETNYQGDFSSVKDAGTYYISCSGLEDSYTFTIGDTVYNNLLDESVRMLYLQRCGTQINDSKFGHAACHTDMATVYGTNNKIDVSGGWHDAGDYGRYTVAAAKAVADLLYAYDADPSAYSDNIGIPESNNGTPDILDEVRYELEWMLKMQAPSGGAYHKVSCATFPAYVMPQAEKDPLIVTPVSSTATADFCASMALAYEFYKDIDGNFADKCLTAAKKAWDYLQANPQFDFKNPSDIVTGEYGDKTDVDERYWAAAQMYRATGDSKYLNSISFASSGMDWSTVGDYGNIAILTMKDVDKNSTAYQNAKQSIIYDADKYLKNTNNSAYGVSQTRYNWGSNMTIANSGITMALAYQLTGDSKYLDAAESQLNYLLGVNPLGTCFVTGFGTVSPENPHHRPSMAVGEAMKGMLVGGVNSSLEDSAAKAYCADAPAAKCYVDNSESYSTNEITIYWNSPLTYLLSATSSGNNTTIIDPPVPGGIWGDANVSGEVKMNDAVLVMQAIANADTYGVGGSDVNALTERGEYLADVYEHNNGDLTNMDALTIQKYLIHSVTELPVSYKQGTTPPPPTTTTAVITTTDTTTVTTVATTTKNNGNSIPDRGTPMNSNATLVADFRKGQPSTFMASDGWSNESVFDCFWHKENTSYKDGVLNLTIDQKRSDSKYPQSANFPYSAAEYRTTDFYHYGYYETSMQAIKNDGVVSSFFTYTGPSDNNPWDEIDIEVLGKDTTKVQLNYYTNGVGNHEYMYDLGFDASEAFHTYGFDWQPDHITWYVDGKAVYTATQNIPSTAGKIMMNVWPGVSDPNKDPNTIEWLKPFNGKTPLTARYQWVTYNKQ